MRIKRWIKKWNQNHHQSLLATDYQYCMSSPSSLKRKLHSTLDVVNSCKKKLKLDQQRNRRLKKKVNSLQCIVDSMKEKLLITESCSEMIEKSFSGVPLEVMKRVLCNDGAKNPSHAEYHPVLKSFALTLQFYSSKAYDYVRENFNLALPSPCTLRRWYGNVNGKPGFSDEVLFSLGVKAKAAKANNKPFLCSLMLDEMAIRKHVEFDGHDMIGFVDLGTGIPTDDSAPLATEVLVFMVVCLNGSWKVPVAYFLIHGLSGVERANLIDQCIRKLYDVGVDVVSLTCDGPSCHFSMLKALGASMDPFNLKPYFPHPSLPGR